MIWLSWRVVAARAGARLRLSGLWIWGLRRWWKERVKRLGWRRGNE